MVDKFACSSGWRCGFRTLLDCAGVVGFDVALVLGGWLRSLVDGAFRGVTGVYICFVMVFCIVWCFVVDDCVG